LPYISSPNLVHDLKKSQQADIVEKMESVKLTMYFLTPQLIIESSISEISCPKTDCPKKCVLLSIVECFRQKQIYNFLGVELQVRLLFILLPDNSEIFSKKNMKNKMSEAARRKAREYQRLWRQRNPDKVRQNIINYWERKVNEDNIPSLKNKVIDLKKQGLSLRDIGKKLNISHMKVKRLLQACNTL
jgi:hypothetical protein